ncbi:MAG: hypothetical protein KatS3mg013_0429 [Actinomycetota bacterium]|jgi:uncharacterized protein YkwD|nr:MAG: hypothetical protein KatS3mg013_0429 [Actinomycetota bacterium]
MAARSRHRAGVRAAVAGVVVALVVGALAGSALAATPPLSVRDRRAMLRETNDARLQENLHRVRIHAELSELARRHSARMAREGRLFHTWNAPAYYLDGRRWSWWGENVGMVPSGSVEELHRAFMRSAPHRSNILNRAFTRVAIGAVRRDGALWVTVFFWRP